MYVNLLYTDSEPWSVEVNVVCVSGSDSPSSQADIFFSSLPLAPLSLDGDAWGLILFMQDTFMMNPLQGNRIQAFF